jgi:hypothetical protein
MGQVSFKPPQIRAVSTTLTYAQEVLADSPWGFWRLLESGGDFADSSGNNRTLSALGTPNYLQTGPASELPAISLVSTTNKAGTTATSTSSTVTLEFWVKIPTGSIIDEVPLFHMQLDNNTYDKVVYVDTAGKIAFSTYNGAEHITATASAVTRDVWHHVVASIGAAGQKLRINKTTAATDAATTSYTGAQVLRLKGVNAQMNGDNTIHFAAPAFYTTQLSDARTDAHYDAAVAAGTPTDITGGILTASSTFSGAVASRAQDGNNSTEWMSNGVVACQLNVFYGVPKTVAAYRIRAHTQVNRAPYSWTFQGSDDGATWTTLDTQTAVAAWTSGEQRVFTLASPGTYSQFRFNSSAKFPAGDNYISMAEFWPQAVTPGTTPVDISGGTLSASSTFGTAAASRAQDGSLGSEWMANNVIPCWLKVVYGASKTVVAYRISACDFSSQWNRSPGTWTLDGSNDGSSWTTLDSQTSAVAWTSGATRGFVLSSPATYTQFRLNVTAKQTGAADNYINLSEFWVRE